MIPARMRGRLIAIDASQQRFRRYDSIFEIQIKYKNLRLQLSQGYAIIIRCNRICFCFPARVDDAHHHTHMTREASPEEDQCASVAATTNYCSLSRPCDRARTRSPTRSTVCVSQSLAQVAR